MNFKPHSTRNCNKKLIRNGEGALPKNVCVETKISEYEITDSDESIQQETDQKQTKQTDDIALALDVPTKNFSKCIEKRMEKIGNLEVRKLKSHTELTKDERVTFNEKITKHVLNFPFDKKLYKELISLQLNDKPNIPVLQPISVNYEPAIRDKVPKLEDFYVPLQKTEFNIPVLSTLGCQTTTRSYDGLRMHKLMCIWKNENTYH